MTTLLLVDDHPLIRKGIRAILEEYKDVRVVGEANNGLEAVQYARHLHPAVILMDVNMPHMDGVQATRLIKEEQPAVIIIGLSVNEAGSVREAMLQAGASEYLRKEDVGVHLHETLQRVIANSTA